MLNKDIGGEYQSLPSAAEPDVCTDGGVGSYNVIPRRARRRQACSSICCCLLVLTFMLTFFLVPRDPQVSYVETEPYNITTKTLQQIFTFKNNNYYHMDWSNLHLEVQLCTFTDPDAWLTAECEVNNPIAVYDYQDSFSTKMQGSVDLLLDFNTSLATPQQVVTIATLCSPYNKNSVIAFRTVGTIDAKLSNGHSFGNSEFSHLALVGCA